ncbi:phage holin, LLH family [Vagococcus silagei]|uniref:Phage holin n=1 Tax=Vagococcus silagei TaxID=2508885 RepID=A0A4V3TVA6_9ENTE|nr:phage holin, LLH family [Vagococcus silagei]THB62169.1 hypothetical protein ESZ54_01110 [Vagococcus silagei]
MDIQTAVLNLMAAILISILGFGTKQVTTFLKNKGVVSLMEKKQEQVGIAVKAVEQIATIENISDKYKAAKTMSVELLNEYGIRLTETELKAFIESAVSEMNKNIEDVLNDN